MAQTHVSQAEPFEREGWGYHDCCCDHIVEQIDAAPMPSKAERYAQAREQWYACPHHELTPLEVYLGTLR